LVFSKSRALDFNVGLAISGVIKNYLEKLYGVTLSESNCITLDVFHRRAMPASSDFRSIENKIKKACIEIGELWPTITN